MPNANILVSPCYETFLYKIMTIENLLKSVDESYLHFNRVDSYLDYNDGEQPPRDRTQNSQQCFEKSPNTSWEDHCDKARSRTYACCFSLENSTFIWANYGGGNPEKQVCLVFHYGKLRQYLNEALNGGRLFQGDTECHQIFDINYGKVAYIDWQEHFEGKELLPNAIQYSFLKDNEYSDENELRISLSFAGGGQFHDFSFEKSIQLGFNFKEAFQQKIISGIEVDREKIDPDFLARLRERGFNPAE